MSCSKLKKRVFTAAVWVFFALLLCGCTPSVRFAAGKAALDSTELTMVLQEGETALLNDMTALKRADLSGSVCYEEIMDWGAKHPEVELIYTVEFPDGSIVRNDAASADLSALGQEQIEEAGELLDYLPGLEELVLLPGEFSAREVDLLCQGRGLKTQYSFSVAGQELDYYSRSVDLSNVSEGDMERAMELLPYLPELKLVELGAADEGGPDWESACALMELCPELRFEYDFEIYGREVSLSDRKIDLSHIKIDDGGAQLVDAARYMKKLGYVDMDSCGLDNAEMEQLCAVMPEVKLVWRVWFGGNYSVRTDVERILASKPSRGGLVTDRNSMALKYCTDLKYLDLGHNELISDISFLSYMPKLEVVILAMNDLSDLSPLGSCTKLEYLEIQTNDGICDLSPLANCTELAHLNVARCPQISDISPLFGLTKLERLWLGSGNRVPYEQVEQLQSLVPDCQVNLWVWNDPTSDGWRYTGTDPKVLWTSVPILHERYALLCEQFGYTDADYAFYWNDPDYRND